MNDTACFIMADGRVITVDELLAIARTKAGRGRSARIEGNSDLPYRCVGGVIFTLRMAGFDNVAFITEPPP